MKYFWSNSKDKLVLTEEGKVGEALEPFPKNGSCKKFLQIVQFILVLEIAFLLGWICYSFLVSKYNPSMDHVENLEINPLSGGGFNHLHEDLKLNSESPNHSDDVKWQKQSSTEPWSTKTQVFENPSSTTESDPISHNTEDCVQYPGLSSTEVTIPDNIEKAVLLPAFSSEPFSQSEIKETVDAKEDSTIKLMTTDNYENNIIETSTSTSVGESVENEDEFEAKQQISTDDMPSSGVIIQRYHFQISLGPKTEPEENENSLATFEERKSVPFSFRVFFNLSNSEDNVSSENTKNITDPISEVDQESFESSLKIGVPIPQEEETLKWWVNTPEFQDTRGEFQSSEEFQTQDSKVTNNFDNEMSLLEKNMFDLLFGESDLDSAIVPESEKVRIRESTVVTENQPENLDEVLSDFMSSFLSSEDNDNPFSKESDDPSTLENPLSDVFGSLKSSTEDLEKTLEDILKQLSTAEEKQTDDPQQNDSTELKHDIPELVTPQGEDKDSAWTEEEKWLLSGPNWKVNSESEDFSKDFPKISYTYEYEDSADSAEYMYD